MKSVLVIAAVLGILALPAAAADFTPREKLDRLEDRIDRRESFIDRQTDNGWRDRVEDVIDRREDYFDRRGYAGSRRVDRHERRSWWRLWGRH